MSGSTVDEAEVEETAEDGGNVDVVVVEVSVVVEVRMSWIFRVVRFKIGKF